MSLTTQTSSAPNWGRWPQQLPGDYNMMESPSMLPFDSRANANSSIQRPVMSPYMVQGSYSSDQVNNIPAPHYQVSNPYQFAAYQGPPTPPHRSSPFKVEYNERPLGQENDHGRINFETEVDELMKAIQRKAEMQPDAGHQPLTPGMSPVSDASLESHGTPTPMGDKSQRKRYHCNGPNCQKSFTQKTHLDIHRRTHSGEKPYSCDFPGCELTFSQLGNLKTHRRRHTGERPFSCDKCDRQFAQRGNLRAHLQTHQGLKPYVCILDACNKTFSQLGNMKTHQNNFHKKTLKNLTMRFAQILNSGEEVPDIDRELFEYFATHYKNSNKGIKGRGKARTVAERKPKLSNSPVAHPISSIPQYPLPQIASGHQTPSPHQPHGLPVSGSLAAYSMSRVQHNSHTNGYEVYDIQGGHHHIQPPHNAGMMYETSHVREMNYNERMY
ncbi:hypothetical protein FG05_13123 [Fusarium graminearum]|nr:hypothetical protein FG05_13123 [Fusarium graminearum]